MGFFVSKADLIPTAFVSGKSVLYSRGERGGSHVSRRVQKQQCLPGAITRKEGANYVCSCQTVQGKLWFN